MHDLIGPSEELFGRLDPGSLRKRLWQSLCNPHDSLGFGVFMPILISCSLRRYRLRIWLLTFSIRSGGQFFYRFNI